MRGACRRPDESWSEHIIAGEHVWRSRACATDKQMWRIDKPKMTTKTEAGGRVVLDVANQEGRNRLIVTATGDDFDHVKEMRIYTTSNNKGVNPDLWIMSDRRRQEIARTERNLIRAKVKAIVGCAVLGAAFAVTLGALIMASGSKKS